MALIIGIDESGYGPLLGPLVVSGVAFRVPDDRWNVDLWKTLCGSVTDSPSRGERRVVIADSKVLYQRKSGLRVLERTALSAASIHGSFPASFRALLNRVAPGASAGLAEYPWYRDHDAELPTEQSREAIELSANAVRRDLNQSGVSLHQIACESLPEGHFNRLVSVVRNKSTVSFGLVLRLFDRLCGETGHSLVRVLVDRQGGRMHYGPMLRGALDVRHVDVLEESDDRSLYRFSAGDRTVRFEFVTRGETHHLPIALAGILSKYLRELFMIGFNRYWAHRVEGLQPTAGYYQDAQRFLSQIAPAIESGGLDRDLLVRSR